MALGKTSSLTWSLDKGPGEGAAMAFRRGKAGLTSLLEVGGGLEVAICS